jgi:hypothetical protein
MRRGFCYLSFFLIAAGCAYNVQPTSTRAVNLYSAYENKVPGTFALVMDDSIRSVNREITPTTYICSAHRFPISVGDSLAVSIKKSLEAVFENIREQGSAPPADQLTQLGLNGVILVRLDDFSPKVTCHRGFFTGTCTASTDLSFGVTVRGPGGILAGTSAAGSKTADGDAGVYCGGGADVVGDSITRATRDALERLTERLSNSPKLREAGAQYVSAPATSQPAGAQLVPAVNKPTNPTIVRNAALFLVKGPIVSNPPQRFSAEFYDNGRAVALLSGLRRLTGNFQTFGISESIADKYSASLIKPDSVKPQLGSDAKGFAVFSDEFGTLLECSYTFSRATGRGRGGCADNQANTYDIVFD